MTLQEAVTLIDKTLRDNAKEYREFKSCDLIIELRDKEAGFSPEIRLTDLIYYRGDDEYLYTVPSSYNSLEESLIALGERIMKEREHE